MEHLLRRPETAPTGPSSPWGYATLGRAADLGLRRAERFAARGTLALALGPPLHGTQEDMLVGDTVCVEPNTFCREYHVVTAVSGEPGAGAMRISLAAPLAYDHPAGGIVRRVDPQVAEQLMRQWEHLEAKATGVLPTFDGEEPGAPAAEDQ